MILKKCKIVNTNSFIIIFKRVYSNVFDVFSFCKKCKFEVLEDTTNLPCESIIFINHPNISSMFNLCIRINYYSVKSNPNGTCHYYHYRYHPIKYDFKNV